MFHVSCTIIQRFLPFSYIVNAIKIFNSGSRRRNVQPKNKRITAISRTLHVTRIILKSTLHVTRIILTVKAGKDWLFFLNKKLVLHAIVPVLMRSTLRGIGYFLKSRPSSTRKRTVTYEVKAVRDWLFF